MSGPTQPDSPAMECTCVINHPVTTEERADLIDHMRYCRLIGDMDGLRLALVRLLGDCPAKQQPETENES